MKTELHFRKIYTVLLFFFFIFAFSACEKEAAHPLTITSPTSADFFDVGAKVTLLWNGEYEGRVNIKVVNGMNYWTIATEVQNIGEYSFTLPSEISGDKIQILLQRADYPDSYTYSAFFKVGSGGESPVVAPNLVAHYPMNNNGDDVSGNNYHASPYGVTATYDRNSQSSSAYYFDSSDFLYVQANFDPLPDFSVAFWAKPQTYSQTGTILYKNNVLGLQYTNGYIQLSIGDGSDFKDSFYGNSYLGYGSWMHIVVTVKNKQISVFVNGALQESGAFDSAEMGSNSSEYWFIGNDSFQSTQYKGALDELQIFDNALSSDLVYKLYNTGSIADAKPNTYSWASSQDSYSFFYDDFSTSSTTWLTGYSSGEYNVTISSGKYRVETLNDNSWIFWPTTDDFNLSADFQFDCKVLISNTVNDHGSGIYWGDSEFNNYYYMVLSRNNNFKIAKVSNGTSTAWFDWQANENIINTQSSYNKLTVRKVSGIYYFFINEIFVGQYTDSSSLPGKYFAVHAQPSSTILFDDFSVMVFSSNKNIDNTEYKIYAGTNQKKTKKR